MIPVAARFLAIDWSGAKQVGRKIWLAAVENGRVERLERISSREAAVQVVLEEVQAIPESIVGLDFPFSFPEWFVRHHECRDVLEFWGRVEGVGLAWLSEPPFHSRGSWKSGPFGREQCLRRTDMEVGGFPESAFKVVGPKQVAKGALLGIPALRRFRQEGIAIWPFDRPRLPLALEIFPRALYEAPVTKRDLNARSAYLDRFAAEVPEPHRAAAVGSDDAFDALASALRMYRERESLARLAGPLQGYSIEGRIWAPSGVTSSSRPGAREELHTGSES